MENLIPEDTICTKYPNDSQYSQNIKTNDNNYNTNLNIAQETYLNNKFNIPQNSENFQRIIQAPKINMTRHSNISKSAFPNTNKNIFKKNNVNENLNNSIYDNSTDVSLGSITSLLLNKQTKKKEVMSRHKTQLEDFFHTKYIFNCKAQLFLSVITIMTCIIEYECTVIKDDNNILIHSFANYDTEDFPNIDPNYKKISKRVARLCSIVTFIISIFLWISIFFDFILGEMLHIGIIENTYKLILHNKKHLFKSILTIILYFLCPNPFTFGIECNIHSHQFNYDYKIPLNSIFTSICLFRTWFIFKYYLVSSCAYSQRSFRICKMNGVKMSLTFPFKANMAQESLIIDLFLFVICWLVCSYNIRIYERYIDEISGNHFDNFYNDLWCVFISMTTVGYGDMSPTTDLGRIFIIIGCFCGVFLVGLVVVSVTSYLNISGMDLNVYQALEKSNKLQKRKETAISAVTQYFKYRKKLLKNKEQSKKIGSNKNINNIKPTDTVENLDIKSIERYNLDDKKVKKYRKVINKKLDDFKAANEDFMNTIPPLNDFDNIALHLKFLEENVTRNQERLDETLNLLDQLNSAFEKIE